MGFNKVMNMEDKIKQAIENNFNVESIEVINESSKHAGHAGDDGTGQTHFILMVVSNDFAGYNRVQRQRMVNNAIKHCFNEGLHAISFKLSTQNEIKI